MAIDLASDARGDPTGRARAEQLRALAAEINEAATVDGLCEPVAVPWLSALICDTDGHLFALRWFNPFGPTHLEFLLKQVPGRDHSLLIVNQCHILSPATWVLGSLAPERHDHPEKLVAVFQQIARRETASANPLVPSCPTTAHLGRNNLVDALALRAIVRALLHAVDAAALEQAIRYLDRFPARPWDRTAAERDETFARLEPTFKAGLPLPEPTLRGLISEELFAAWWTRITGDAHVRAELAEFPRAWEAAIRFWDGALKPQDMEEPERRKASDY